MPQTLDASKHWCKREHFNTENDLWRGQGTRAINNFTLFCFNYFYATFTAWLSLSSTHTVYTAVLMESNTAECLKNTTQEHILPTPQRRCEDKYQTNIKLHATGSYRYSIDILKKWHWKIVENTSAFFQISSQAHFLRFHFVERSFILSTSRVSNRVPDSVPQNCIN